MNIAHPMPHFGGLLLDGAANSRSAVPQTRDAEGAGQIEIFMAFDIAHRGPLGGFPENRKIVRGVGDVAALDCAEPLFQFLIRGTHGAGGCATDAEACGWPWLQ